MDTLTVRSATTTDLGWVKRMADRHRVEVGFVLLVAARRGTVWEDGRWAGGPLGERPGPELLYRAFARSCANIAAAWRR